VPSVSQQVSTAQFDHLVGRAEKTAELLKTMGHGSRLVILCLLLEGEKTVSEIENVLQQPQATVSQHLARLRQDKLLVTRRSGRKIYYRLASQEVRATIETIYQLFC